MSSTSYQPRNSRWRPTLPEPRKTSAAAKRLVAWSAGSSAACLIGIFITLGTVWFGRQAHPWSADLAVVLGVVWLPLVVVDAAVTWWLMWRLARAEADGVDR